jgi:hypothetical protein
VPHSSPCLTTLANVHPCEGASSSRFMAMHRLATVARRFFRRVLTLTTGDWDSSNQAFTMSAGSNATCGTASSHSCALLPACSCPVDLSIAGKLVAQTPPSSASRLRRGYDDAPHGAHRACASRRTRLSMTTGGKDSIWSSTVGNDVECVTGSQGLGIRVPRYRYRSTRTPAG